MYGYTSIFPAIFTKGNNFYDFLLASLDDILDPKSILKETNLLPNPIEEILFFKS